MSFCRLIGQLTDVNVPSTVGMFTYVPLLRMFSLFFLLFYQICRPPPDNSGKRLKKG